jgi:hypothetical protein
MPSDRMAKPKQCSQDATVSCQTKKKNRKEKKNNENKEGKKEDAKEKREDAE